MAVQPSPPLPDVLKLAFWNARNVTNKKDELHEFIQRHDLDVIALSETFLEPSKKFSYPNFSTYRSDRGSYGGGTAILIKSCINHYAEGPITGLTNNEANSIVLITNDNKKIRLISIYGLHKTLTTDDLNKIFKDDLPLIVVGDFNCKHISWNSTKTNNRGRKLLDYAIKNHIITHVFLSPTYYSETRPQDAASRDAVINIIDAVVDLSSDHVPVLAEI